MILSLCFAVEDGYNSTEFREYIRDRIELMYGVFGETTVTSVQKAVEFQYTPWPHIENRENNRDQLIEVFCYITLYIVIKFTSIIMS